MEPLEKILTAWHAKYGTGFFVARDLFLFEPTAEAAMEEGFRLGATCREPSPHRLAHFLARHEGEVAGGFRLVKAGKFNRMIAWRAEPVATRPEGMGGPAA